MKYQNIYYAILLFLSVAFIPWESVAQTEFGVKGGPLFTNWRHDHSGSGFKTETKTGVSAGGFYRINNLLGPVNFQAEFLYQLKGAKTFITSNTGSSGYNPYGYSSYGYGYGGYGFGYSAYGYSGYSGYSGYGGYGSGYGYDNGNGPWITGQESFHYFNIPLLASVTAFKVIDFYAGPEIGYMFAATGYRRLAWGEVKKFSAGVSTGIAIHLGVNTKLDLRYSTNFTTLSEAGTTEFRNQSFAFTVQQTLFRKQPK
jgi:hypothetical protein